MWLLLESFKRRKYKMKKLSYLLSGALAVPSVMADFSSGCSMMGFNGNYRMMGNFGMGLYGLVWAGLVAFVFALVFWSTYKWLMGNKKNRRK